MPDFPDIAVTSVDDTDYVPLIEGSGGNVYNSVGVLHRLSVGDLSVALKRPLYVPVTAGGATTWTDMPSAATEYVGTAFRRTFADLTGVSTYRLFLSMQVGGFAGAVMRAQYTTDLTGVAGWATIDSTVDLAVPTTGVVAVASVGAVPAAARGPVLLRLQGQGGDGVVDPVFVVAALIFK